MKPYKYEVTYHTSWEAIEAAHNVIKISRAHPRKLESIQIKVDDNKVIVTIPNQESAWNFRNIVLEDAYFFEIRNKESGELVMYGDESEWAQFQNRLVMIESELLSHNAHIIVNGEDVEFAKASNIASEYRSKYEEESNQ